MIYHIDPKVDCVFKKLLGSDENKNLLIHFANSILELESPITEVTILNPYNEKDFETDKLTIVDVKAEDDKGRIFQIEIQLALHPAMTNRILYTWADIYSSSIRSGEEYSKLNPVYSIWLLASNVYPDIEAVHLPFQVFNREFGILLSDQLSIHLIQLGKWKKNKVENSKDIWIHFFNHGEALDDANLPDSLNISEIKQAMDQLKAFKENERNYHIYQSRLDAIRVHNTWKSAVESEKKAKEEAIKAKEKALREKEKALGEKEKERKAKEEALKTKEKEREAKEKEREAKEDAVKAKADALNEIERLKAMLRKSGIKP